MDTDTRDAATRDPAPPEHDDDPVVEGSVRSRFAISVFIVVTLLAVLACTMPASSLRNGLLTKATPYLAVTGLDQTWAVFAPSVRPMSIFISARVDHADGSSAVYPFPYSSGISAYWNYRWQKYGEQISQGSATDRERNAYANWVAEQDRESGRRPVRVTLLARLVPNLPPGLGPDTGPAKETPFYTTRVEAT